MGKQKRMLTVGVLAILFAITTSSYGAIPLPEREALIAFYNSTNGDSWTNNTNWNGEAGTEGTWYGITVANDHVKEIDLGSNNLTGHLPPELGNLPDLNYIYLNDNQLSGSLPPELGNLMHLNYIHLGDNQIAGSIPPEIGNLTDLGSIQFFGNQFTGSIPPELGNLANLLVLNLSENQFSGAIPPELGNLANLKELYLEYNQLSGPIPGTLTNLTNLYNCENSPWGSNGLYINDNQLYTDDPAVKAFVDLKACTGWESTQKLKHTMLPSIPSLLLSD